MDYDLDSETRMALTAERIERRAACRAALVDRLAWVTLSALATLLLMAFLRG